jgi:hypothetical protein
MRGGAGDGDNRQVAGDFHFCEEPTVTAGLIGFAFDIRVVIIVARYGGDGLYAGGGRRCRGDYGNHSQQV